MKQSLLASTAAAVVVLAATFAAAQTDQTNRGDRHSRPEAAATQGQGAQPAREPQRTAPTQAQGNQAQPMPAQPQPQIGQRGREPGAATEHGGRGEARQNQPATTTNPATPSGQQRGENPPMPQGNQPRTARDQQRPDRNVAPQTPMQQRNLPQNAQTATPYGQRPEATGHFGIEGQAPVGTARHWPQAPAGVAPERGQFTERFGTERGQFGERFGAEPWRPGFGVTVTERQRTLLRERFAAVPLHRTERLGFSVAVGAVVPRTLALYPLPTTVATVVPQFRGYRYVADQENIVIVEPRSYRVVAVMPMGEVGYGASLPHATSDCR